MGRRVMIVIFGMLFSLGAVVAAWVPVARVHTRKMEWEREIQGYEAAVQRLGEDGLGKHISLARWYNHALDAGTRQAEAEGAYDQIGNLGRGIMGWIEVPELYWKIPLYHWTGTEPGAYHQKQTSFPLGIPGQISIFSVTDEWDMARLEAGMEVRLSFLGECRTFRAAGPEEAGEWLLEDHLGKTAVSMVTEQGQEDFRHQTREIPKDCCKGILAFWLPPLVGEMLRIFRMPSDRRKSKKAKTQQYI